MTKNAHSWLRVAAVAALVSSPVHPSVAQDKGDDVEDLRREVKALRAQMAALKAALAEAAEYDRLRATALGRAIGGSSTASEPPAPSLPREREAAEPATKPSGRSAAARKAPAPSMAPAEAAAGVIRGRVEVPAGEPVAYVYVENIRGPAVRGEKVRIDQVNKQFVPSWAVVQRGTTVEFPNRDNIYHNVFSLSSGNSFDLGLYNAAGDPKAHTFDEAGSADIYCNIHPQMAASVLVVPNRYHAKVKPDGTFEIAGVPGGRRKVVAWAPGSRLVGDWVDLTPGGNAELSLKLERKSGAHKNKQSRPYGSYE